MSGFAQKEDPLCELCEGRGYVVEEVCGGCGRPAWESDPVSYCGRKECLDRVVEVRTEAEVKVVTMAEWRRGNRYPNTHGSLPGFYPYGNGEGYT